MDTEDAWYIGTCEGCRSNWTLQRTWRVRQPDTVQSRCDCGGKVTLERLIGRPHH